MLQGFNDVVKIVGQGTTSAALLPADHNTSQVLQQGASKRARLHNALPAPTPYPYLAKDCNGAENEALAQQHAEWAAAAAAADAYAQSYGFSSAAHAYAVAQPQQATQVVAQVPEQAGQGLQEWCATAPEAAMSASAAHQWYPDLSATAQHHSSAPSPHLPQALPQSQEEADALAQVSETLVASPVFLGTAQDASRSSSPPPRATRVTSTHLTSVSSRFRLFAKMHRRACSGLGARRLSSISPRATWVTFALERQFSIFLFVSPFGFLFPPCFPLFPMSLCFFYFLFPSFFSVSLPKKKRGKQKTEKRNKTKEKKGKRGEKPPATGQGFCLLDAKVTRVACGFGDRAVAGFPPRRRRAALGIPLRYFSKK